MIPLQWPIESSKKRGQWHVTTIILSILYNNLLQTHIPKQTQKCMFYLASTSDHPSRFWPASKWRREASERRTFGTGSSASKRRGGISLEVSTAKPPSSPWRAPHRRTKVWRLAQWLSLARTETRAIAKPPTWKGVFQTILETDVLTPASPARERWASSEAVTFAAVRRTYCFRSTLSPYHSPIVNQH